MKTLRIILLILTVVFAVLCFVGAGYVLVHDGAVNAGYAVVPMCLCLCCSVLLQSISRKNR